MRALFLDRDGVINENRADHVKRPEEFRLLPGVLRSLVELVATNLRVVVVTNQAALGRGHITDATLNAIHTHLLQQVHGAGGRLDAIYVCPHPPEADCLCRKPRTKLLRQAAADLGIDLSTSYFVGDAVSDVQAAIAVGARPILVLTGRGWQAQHELREREIRGYWLAADLAAAVSLVIAAERVGAQAGQTAPNLLAAWQAPVPPLHAT